MRHLAEIDSCKLFFRQGFFSLFDYVYAVRELGYSEGAAYGRIKAMKLCRELPETANRLQSGKLSLSAASQLQVFFEKQDKKIKEEEKAELAVTFAPKLRQKDEILKHLEALSGKPVASAWQQISPTIKLLISTNKSAELTTSARKSGQINQYSKEKATFMPKPRA